jgi:outer membrane protein assembly complex protein YaeT
MPARPVAVRLCRALVVASALAALPGCGALGSSSFVATDATGREVGTPIVVRFEGNRELPRHRLIRVIEDRIYDLSSAPDGEAILEDIRFDIEDFYREEGHPDVEVATRLEAFEDRPGRQLTIVVSEGPLVTVRRMEVRGGLDYPRDRLLDFWLQRSSGALGLGDPLFVHNDVLGFVQSLQIFLRGEGYLDARTELAEIVRSADGDEVDLLVRIEEGTRYLIGEVEIAAELLAVLDPDGIAAPRREPATARLVDEFRTSVLEQLRAHGRPEPRIRAVLSRRIDGDGHFVDLRIVGEPGPLARIVGVELTGLVRTEESVVRDRLTIPLGELYDGGDVDASLRELYLSGLFERVDLERVWVEDEGGAVQPTAEEARPMRIRLTLVERQTRSIEALVGWGSYERARGNLRFEEANLFGTGRGLVVEGRMSQKGWRGLATVSDPNFLDTGLGLSVSGDAMEREEPSFVSRAYGGTIALSRRFGDALTARVGYSHRLHDDLESDVLTPAASITRYLEGSPFVEARYDTRDSLIYPREGWQAIVQVNGNDPAFGADISFARVRFGASWYRALSDRASVALRTEMGWLWPGEGSDQVPLQERFYNGGENTVRSFRESEVGPLDANGEPIGGEFRNLFSAELRNRLFGTLEGALFADAGNVGADISDYGFADMRYALGLGLRLALPIGPVRVDAGWNPDRRPGESEWVVHLSVGYPF